MAKINALLKNSKNDCRKESVQKAHILNKNNLKMLREDFGVLCDGTTTYLRKEYSEFLKLNNLRQKDFSYSEYKKLLISSGIINQSVARIESLKKNKDYFYRYKVCPLIDPITSKIYFYSTVLDQVVPVCPKQFRDEMKFSKREFEIRITPAELRHDPNLKEGIVDDEFINCTSYAPWVFD